MASLGDLAERLEPAERAAAPRASRLCFPNSAHEPVARLAEGMLRAPRRGWRPPPILSACAAGTRRALPRAAPGLATPARILGERGLGDLRRCWRVRPRRGGRWSRRGSAAPGGRPAPNRRCRRARLAVVALAEPALADAAADADGSSRDGGGDARCGACPPIRPSGSSCWPRRGPRAGLRPLAGSGASTRRDRDRARLRPLAAARPRRPRLQRRRRDRLSRAARRRAGDRLRRRLLYRLGRHRGRRRGAAARLPPLGRRDFRRRLPRRDALPRPVPRRRDRLRGGAGDRRRLAPDRDRQPPHRGMRRHVVLEAAADRRFPALVGRRAGIPPHRRGRAGGGPRAPRRRSSGAIAGWASRLPAGLAEAAARPACR